MTVRVYNTIPGQHAIIDASNLRYKNILKVKREGRGYDIIQSSTFLAVTPPNTSRIVSYYQLFGELIFANDMPFDPGETVYVLYE